MISTRNARRLPPFPGRIPRSRACTPGEIFGNYSCWVLDVPAMPHGSFCSAPVVPSLGGCAGAVLELHGEDEGLCTLSCWEGAPGAEFFPSRNVLAWENSCDFITTFCLLFLLKAGRVKEGKLMQSNRKVGSSKLCYCSSTVLVISGFLMEFWGKREEARGERVSEGWACCLFSLVSCLPAQASVFTSSALPQPQFCILAAAVWHFQACRSPSVLPSWAPRLSPW